MESLGVSMEDATKIMTVAHAFRKAHSSRSSTVAAIDELTSRLCLTKLSRNDESSAPSPDVPKSVHITQHEKKHTSSVDISTRIVPSSAAAVSKKGQRVPTFQKGEKQKSLHTAGRKRVLNENAPEKVVNSGDSDVRLNGPTANHLVEKDIINAKISKDEKKPVLDSSTRTKVPAPSGARGKRASSPQIQQTVKRSRTTSEDICPTI